MKLDYLSPSPKTHMSIVRGGNYGRRADSRSKVTRSLKRSSQEKKPLWSLKNCPLLRPLCGVCVQPLPQVSHTWGWNLCKAHPQTSHQYSPMLINAHQCSPMLMLTNAHQCSLTNSHQCSPMVTNLHQNTEIITNVSKQTLSLHQYPSTLKWTKILLINYAHGRMEKRRAQLPQGEF